MFILRPLLFPSRGVRRLGLNCEYRIGQRDFIDWICPTTEPHGGKWG